MKEECVRSGMIDIEGEMGIMVKTLSGYKAQPCQHV